MASTLLSKLTRASRRKLDARERSEPKGERRFARYKDESGIAIFMVLSAVAVLALLVTEFTYIASLNQKLAFDGLDQIKAHYLAKSGLKLSLLRLKAYLTVKDVLGGGTGGGDSNKNSNSSGGGGGGNSMVPKALLDKIWSFPFMYPIPTNVPGLTIADKEQIEKFQNASGLEGSFTALIESESSRYNINSILPQFGPSPIPNPSSSPSPNPSGNPPQGTSGGGASPSPSPSFNVDDARKSLQDYLQTLYTNQATADQDFAEEYRDFRIDDLMDTIFAWADPTYERKASGAKDAVPMKHAPFYSLTELHMLPGIDDGLYNIFAPTLTALRTNGININTMREATLHALVPQMTDDEVTEFFKTRDSVDEDNSFKTPDDFYKYLSNSVAAFQKNQDALNKLKDSLVKRNIQLITDETTFRITVQAQVNSSIRKIETWVTIHPTPQKTSNSNTSSSNPNQPQVNTQTTGTTTSGNTEVPDSGIQILFMRIL